MPDIWQETIGDGERAMLDALNIDAVSLLGRGSEGPVFCLRDGGVVKLTRSEDEAAIAHFLAGSTVEIPGAPRFSNVLSTLHPDDAEPVYALFRSDIPDLEPDFGSVIDILDELYEALPRQGPVNDDAVSCVIASCPDNWRVDIVELAETVRGFRDHGVVLADWFHVDNLGRDEHGRIGVRDLGFAFVPYQMLRTLRSEVPMVDARHLLPHR